MTASDHVRSPLARLALAAGGVGVLYVANCSTPPSGSATAGGVLYVQSGALKYLGSSGSVTTIASA